MLLAPIASGGGSFGRWEQNLTIICASCVSLQVPLKKAGIKKLLITCVRIGLLSLQIYRHLMCDGFPASVVLDKWFQSTILFSRVTTLHAEGWKQIMEIFTLLQYFSILVQKHKRYHELTLAWQLGNCEGYLRGWSQLCHYCTMGAWTNS
jgi:hypothetical protein